MLKMMKKLSVVWMMALVVEAFVVPSESTGVVPYYLGGSLIWIDSYDNKLSPLNRDNPSSSSSVFVAAEPERNFVVDNSPTPGIDDEDTDAPFYSVDVGTGEFAMRSTEAEYLMLRSNSKGDVVITALNREPLVYPADRMAENKDTLNENFNAIESEIGIGNESRKPETIADDQKLGIESLVIGSDNSSEGEQNVLKRAKIDIGKLRNETKENKQNLGPSKQAEPSKESGKEFLFIPLPASVLQSINKASKAAARNTDSVQ